MPYLLEIAEMVTAPAAMEKSFRMSWLVLHTRKLSLGSTMTATEGKTIAMVVPLVGLACVLMVACVPEISMPKLGVGRRLSGITTG
jgi:hypothetical protein